MIKLRISDDDFNDALHDYARDRRSVDAVREIIESAGIEAPAVTVEELANVVIKTSWGAPTEYAERVARAVLELMQRRTVPAAPGSQWVDLARVTDEELGHTAFQPILNDCSNLETGRELRARLVEKCGGAR